ncbi:iron-containing redox enzyme family protein [Planktothrix pseudagardhii]|uniref:Iron-containing redox enzyme family protein n=1 Tax=Planktothrix pseudagardhii TaxID=132604 RepID=A0A9W4CMN4_9CYAN|nr:iron-containing redox enzyme family protein [Planktothrix pseudagardhii]CAD5959324.1 hypothetical protein NO713_03094 [Planktothrix pseudagardhii]
MTATLSPDQVIKGISTHLPSLSQSVNFIEAEEHFIQLLNLENLDQKISIKPELVQPFEVTLNTALLRAYTEKVNNNEIDLAHLFLQRILYRINRLNLFWYDDLKHYSNERSYYLNWVRDRIEEVWQTWENAQFDLEEYKQQDIKQALNERSEVDLNPAITENKYYLRHEMTLEGYKHLLAIASLDGLVEASRMSRILGGASNEVQATLILVLLEEYGNGRLNRKHSTFFAQMMAELGLETEPEAYFNIVPWEVLASINHNFLLTECKRYFLRYNGGLTYFEIAGPAIYTDYKLAAERLKLSDTAMGYWALHIREDERHGRWMLDKVALPLVDRYPNDAWQILLGYDQEKWMGDRAGDAVIKAVKQAEKSVSNS